MRKLVLLVALMAVPAFAMTAVVDDTAKTLTLDSTADGVNIVALGLTVDSDSGTIDSVAISPSTFNIYMDSAFTAGNSYTYGAGIPTAMIDQAGELALPADDFAISAGMLNGEEDAGADGAAVVTITFTGDAAGTISLNAIRGGVVATDGTALAMDPVAFDFAGAACGGDFDASGNVTATDITLLVNYWLANKAGFGSVAPLGAAGYVEGMDIDSSGGVTATDITLLVNHWLANKSGFGSIAPCM